jgi:peptidoglycan/LPS O-acetylase OafA/YrhL
MSPASSIRVRLLGASNLDESYQHSILISALRSVAALQVVAAHLRGALFPGLRTVSDPTLWYQVLAFLTGFSHLAVLIFFLLSGWLVGGSLLNKLGEPRILVSYAIDRLTRMWIVLVPAFLLTLALGIVTEAIDPKQISVASDNEYSLAAFIGNLLGLQGMAVPRFGGNFSLWSLSNEMWYYALFPLLLLPFMNKSRFTKIAGLLITALILFQLLPDLVLYFPIWLLGAAFSRVQIDLSRAARFFLILVLIALAVFLRLSGSIGTLIAATFPEDLLFSLIFLCLLSSLQFPADRARLGNRIGVAAGILAPFSFTLYVVHYPLLNMVKSLAALTGTYQLSACNPRALVPYAVLFMSMIAFSYMFHLPFEAQTYRVRRLLKRLILKPARRS